VPNLLHSFLYFTVQVEESLSDSTSSSGLMSIFSGQLAQSYSSVMQFSHIFSSLRLINY